MVQKILLATIAIATIGVLAVVAAPSAEAVNLFDPCAGNSSPICKSAGPSGDDASNTVASIISALMWIIGVVGVIMIVVAGIKYTTSNGDANKIQSAKNTLLYAVIGIAVAILGQAIVIFVVQRLTAP